MRKIKETRKKYISLGDDFSDFTQQVYFYSLLNFFKKSYFRKKEGDFLKVSSPSLNH